jgi:hypothetical protein
MEQKRKRSPPNKKQTPDRQTADIQTADIDEQIEDSFPASDPPSYSGGGRVGQPRRSEEKAPEKARNK